MAGQPLRILAIEPDGTCRGHLQQLLIERIDADVIVVSTAVEAAGAMHRERPDLVLMSAVLPPRAEEQVMDALKHLDPDGMVPVITVPPMLAPLDSADPRRGLFTLISRRRHGRRAAYDAAVLTSRIEETLRQVREAKDLPPVRRARAEPSAALIVREMSPRLITAPTAAVVDADRGPLLFERKRLERAQRFGADELPSRCTLTTPAGFIVRMLNVSATGVLFESPLKFTRDSETAFSLLAPDATHVLPARIVRSEVATVNGVGVTYQTAAHFSETVELVKRVAAGAAMAEPIVRPAEIVTAPPSLADLLTRITTDVYQHQRSDAARAAFEAGLKQLMPACAVRLSDRLVQRADGGDSIYFAVPGASGAMVQATFDPGHEPTADEFKLLRAAAAMAAVIVHGETRSLIFRTA